MIYPHLKVEWKNQKQFEQAPEIFSDEKTKALTEVGALLEREIRERTPVKTGILRRSIGAEVFGEKVLIGTPIEYAEPVEYGSRPHLIEVKPGKSIQHPGSKAALMFTRGLAMNVSKVMRILEGIGDKIAARLNK